MVAFLIAVIIGGGSVWGGWLVDQRLLGCRTPIRLILTLALLGVATWLISVIQAAFLLRVPGAYGPVQYWTDAPGGGLDFMALRVMAMFIMLAGLALAVAVPIATIAALCFESSTPKWRRCVIPAIALAAFGVAYQMFFAYEFFPSA